MSTPFAVFGPGILIATRTDVAIPSPVNVGFAQEFSWELAGNTKSLYGQKQFPLAAARGTIKATGKFKAATISGLAWNAMMLGESAFSTGRQAWNVDSTFTVSTLGGVTVGSTVTFGTDLGIKYSTNGLPFQRVSTGSEAAGKYSLTGNVYTFAAADYAKAIKVTWMGPVASGQTLDITNKEIGNTPTFRLDYYTNLNQPQSKPFGVTIWSCVMGKLGLPFKLEDFGIPEFEFDLFADEDDTVMSLFFPEVS